MNVHFTVDIFMLISWSLLKPLKIVNLYDICILQLSLFYGPEWKYWKLILTIFMRIQKCLLAVIHWFYLFSFDHCLLKIWHVLARQFLPPSSRLQCGTSWDPSGCTWHYIIFSSCRRIKINERSYYRDVTVKNVHFVHHVPGFFFVWFFFFFCICACCIYCDTILIVAVHHFCCSRVVLLKLDLVYPLPMQRANCINERKYIGMCSGGGCHGYKPFTKISYFQNLRLFCSGRNPFSFCLKLPIFSNIL